MIIVVSVVGVVGVVALSPVVSICSFIGKGCKSQKTSHPHPLELIVVDGVGASGVGVIVVWCVC